MYRCAVVLVHPHRCICQYPGRGTMTCLERRKQLIEEIAYRFDRRTVTRNSPKHKYTPEQVADALSTVNWPQFGHLPPGQVIPRLVDQGRFVASESTMYRLMRAKGQTRHRRAERRACTRKNKLRAICATAPKQCHTWDIPYLPTTIIGQHY